MSWKDDARKRSKTIGAGDKFKPTEGENTFRILPDKKGKDVPPHREYAMHYEVGPKKRPVVCGKDVNGRGTCWLCDSELPKLAASVNKAKQAMADAMGARPVLALNVSRVDPESGDFGNSQKWLVSSRQLMERILNAIGSRKVDYHDPKKGRNLTVTRTGSGKNDTRYSILEPDSESTVVPEDVLTSIKPLTVDKYSMAAQKAAMLGQDAPVGGGLDEDEDEEEKPKKRRAADDEEDDFLGKKKKKSAKDDEDDDEDEDEDEDEDDEEKPSKKKKSAKVVDEDDADEDDEDADEDDEDDEDEDDEEKPSKKKKSAKVVDEDDEDADEDDEDTDEDDADEDDEDTDEDDEDADEDADEDEDEEPKGKPVKKTSKTAAKAAAPVKATKKTVAAKAPVKGATKKKK